MQQKLYDNLIRSCAIIVDPESELAAFDIDAKSFPRKYDREKVAYKLNLLLPKAVNSIFEIIENPNEISLTSNPELLCVWKEIAVGECISYLQYRLQKIDFEFSPGPKTHAVFLKLLDHFSVSQIYYIIWCKVNDASRWYLEEKTSKKHAANTVIGACEKYGENAVHYGRDLPRYYRPLDCPRSTLTQFFYEIILKLGQSAEDINPSLDWL